MQIQQIEAFVNIYVTRSFARTAERMYLSQSRISQQLKSMESELGIKLFERTNHKVIPTERGSAFYSYAQNILNVYKEGAERLNNLKRDFYIHTQSENHLSPINKALLILSFNHPNASYKILKPVYLDGTVPYEIMSPRHLHLVRENRVTDDRINFFDLGEPYYSVIVKNGNPLSEKETITLDDVRHKKAIMLINAGAQNEYSGPYLGELRKKFEENNTYSKAVTSVSDMMAELISSDYDTVAIVSNSMAITNDIPVKASRLYVPGERHIGFAYIGTATEYMTEFMELAKKGLQAQESQNYL